MNELKEISSTKAAVLKGLKNFNPQAAIITGSGLSGLEKYWTVKKEIPYSKLPYFPKTTVAGHPGKFCLCSDSSGDFIILNGRFHLYEGHSPHDVIYPIRVLNALGVNKVAITAAVGAVNKKYKPNDIVIVKDHINFTGTNPLIGAHIKKFGERFPDMSRIYSKALRDKIKISAKKNKIKTWEGVYFGVLGPSYETPAEIKAFKKLGADIVGMSVAFEAIAAAQMDMEVLGLAYVSNAAAGASNKRIAHSDVLKSGKDETDIMARLLKSFLDK